MFLGKRIKELREERHFLQRQLAASLEIDTPMFSKIERGERKAKREQVILLANLLNVDETELLTLWLAGQVYKMVKDERNKVKALNMVIETLIRENE